MKVLLQKSISRLGKIGDVVEVKPGYARNYLFPQGLAVEPSEANLRTIEIEKQQHLEELTQQTTELEAQATALQGREITISARANEEGQLYGSIGPAQIVAALAAENIFIEPEHLVLDEPIRRLDKYDLTIRFAPEITATIHCWVVPVHEPADQTAEAPDDQTAQPAEESALPAEEATREGEEKE